MAEENIKTSKIVYGAQSANEFIDRSFTELFKTKDPVNISRFFSMYDDLFYNIPKTGDQSHTTLINKSQDYVNNYQNPLQVEVDSLREEVIRLTEQLNETEEENPFYPNGTLLAPMRDDGDPQGHDIHYMDRGVARKVDGMYNSEVFKALKAALGYKHDTPYDDIVLAVPNSIFSSLPRGPMLGIEDLSGQTAAEELEQQTNILASIVVNNWRIELNDLIQPIEDGSVANQIIFINLLKNRINSEYSKELLLEQNLYKYKSDVEYGFTEEARNVGQQLYDLTAPKLNRSRQTLAILARIWAKRADFPNIDFNSILPQTIANNQGEIIGDKSGATQVNPLTDDEIGNFASGTRGKEQFPGVLEGEDYVVSLDNLEYNGEDANRLLNDGIIKVNYLKEIVNKRASNGQAYTEDTGDFYYEPEDFWYTITPIALNARYPKLDYHITQVGGAPELLTQFIRPSGTNYGRRYTFINYTYA